MFKSIQRFFDKKIKNPSGVTGAEVTERGLYTATAALLIEAVKADSTVKDAELKAVTRALEKTFGLSPDETLELVTLAEKEAADSVSLYQFTSLINRGFSYEMKKRIVGLLWSVVFADMEMEKHEEHLVRKTADLLEVSHRDFIDAKIKAKKNAGARG
ncbi:MAG: TerB family tellurite resistance protein [Thermodesulfobacteriota bacterium]